MKKIIVLIAFALYTNVVAMDASAMQKKETKNNCDTCRLAHSADIVEMNGKKYLFYKKMEASFDRFDINHRASYRNLFMIAPAVHERLSEKKEQEEFMNIAQSILMDKYPDLAPQQWSMYHFVQHTRVERVEYFNGSGE